MSHHQIPRLDGDQAERCNAADNQIRCTGCGGWIDFSDLGSVVDHAASISRIRFDDCRHLEDRSVAVAD
jgi:hypothetical protein